MHVYARTVGTYGTGIDTVTVVSPTGTSTYTSYIPFLCQQGEASGGRCLGTSMASNGLNLAELRGLVYCQAGSLGQSSRNRGIRGA